MSKSVERCPNCGYCPHCGRATPEPRVYHPAPYVYPYPYPHPGRMWWQDQITCTTSGATTAAVSA